jgi:hypothetical protein
LSPISRRPVPPEPRSTSALRFLSATIEELKATGFVHDALRRSDRNDATVAPRHPALSATRRSGEDAAPSALA